MAPTPSGKLEKLTILPYKDPAYTESAGEAYSVKVNPEKYSHNHSVSYNKAQGIGTAGASAQFDKILPEKLSFELLFDTTGVIPGSPSDLHQELNRFKKTVYTYNGDIHRPNYVKLSWGSLVFKAQLVSLQIQFNLFKPDGTPLRAKANVDFEGYLDAKTLELSSDNKSPDLTHRITVQAGDTLPLLSYRFYGDSAYYLDLARANGMNGFRKLQPGDQLFFPPLEK